MNLVFVDPIQQVQNTEFLIQGAGHRGYKNCVHLSHIRDSYTKEKTNNTEKRVDRSTNMGFT